MQLFDYQRSALTRLEGRKRVAIYHDMGLGKTYTGSEKLLEETKGHSLVVCQKSKVSDWVAHFDLNTPVVAVDVTEPNGYANMLLVLEYPNDFPQTVFVINYDLIHRRAGLLSEHWGGVIFDESSLLQNEKSKRTKAAMKLAKNSDVLILLSGTPTDGKYERLWSQLRMLGWDISKSMYWKQYVNYRVDTSQGFPIITVKGYKNVDRLIGKMHELGCDFLKTSEAIDLPEQRFITVECPATPELRKFRKKGIVTLPGGTEIVGDSTFAALTGERMLAGALSKYKLDALKTILEGTSERVVVFYNFKSECDTIATLCNVLERPHCEINGYSHDLSEFERDGCVCIVQYQAGAMGLNLQAARYTVYYTPPLASSLFEQSKKRTHRVGQTQACTYYQLVTVGSVEYDIYRNLAKRKDYTDALFERWGKSGGRRKEFRGTNKSVSKA